MGIEVLLKKNEALLCDECNSSNLIQTEQGIVCTECGLVKEELLLSQEQRKAYTNDEKKNRWHHQPVTSDYGSRTLISEGKYSNQKYKWLNKLNSRLHDSRERNYLGRDKYINDNKELFNDDSIIKTAKRIYNKCYEHNLIRGRRISDFVATSLYLSSLINNKPAFLDHFLSELKTKHDKRDITKVISKINGSKIMKELGYKMPQKGIPYDKIKARFRMNQEQINNVINIMESLPKQAINGRDPKGLLAGVIYLNMNGELTQRQIAGIMGVTEVTLRDRAREIKSLINGKNTYEPSEHFNKLIKDLPDKARSDALNIIMQCNKEKLFNQLSRDKFETTSIYASMLINEEEILLEDLIKVNQSEALIIDCLKRMDMYILKKNHYVIKKPLIPQYLKNELRMDDYEFNNLKDMMNKVPQAILLEPGLKKLVAAAAYTILYKTRNLSVEEVSSIMGLHYKGVKKKMELLNKFIY